MVLDVEHRDFFSYKLKVGEGEADSGILVFIYFSASIKRENVDRVFKGASEKQSLLPISHEIAAPSVNPDIERRS